MVDGSSPSRDIVEPVLGKGGSATARSGRARHRFTPPRLKGRRRLRQSRRRRGPGHAGRLCRRLALKPRTLTTPPTDAPTTPAMARRNGHDGATQVDRWPRHLARDGGVTPGADRNEEVRRVPSSATTGDDLARTRRRSPEEPGPTAVEMPPPREQAGEACPRGTMASRFEFMLRISPRKRSTSLPSCSSCGTARRQPPAPGSRPVRFRPGSWSRQ